MDGILTQEELMELLRQVEEDMPRLNAIKKNQLELFHRLRPERCGKIDFEKNEVHYENEKYTKWYSNHGIDCIEDWLRVYDFVELDYELQIAELYDPSAVFSIKFADTKGDNQKYWTAWELYDLYCSFCKSNIVHGEEEKKRVLRDLYAEAYKKATAPKAIFELKFDKVVTEIGEKTVCKARLDEEHLVECSKYGVHLLQINISDEKFKNPIREEIEDGRKVYYFEFLME